MLKRIRDEVANNLKMSASLIGTMAQVIEDDSVVLSDHDIEAIMELKKEFDRAFQFGLTTLQNEVAFEQERFEFMGRTIIKATEKCPIGLPWSVANVESLVNLVMASPHQKQFTLKYDCYVRVKASLLNAECIVNEDVRKGCIAGALSGTNGGTK